MTEVTQTTPEKKLNKNSKAYKDTFVGTAVNGGYIEAKQADKPRIEQLIENGIPVWRAIFQSAVNNGMEVPENFFSMKSEKKDKHVEMWLCAGGTLLVCKHKGKIFATPVANCVSINFL